MEGRRPRRSAEHLPDGRIVETVESSCSIPSYVGVQFHPEFKSRPNKPHPLFCGLIDASLKASVQKNAQGECRAEIKSKSAYEGKGPSQALFICDRRNKMTARRQDVQFLPNGRKPFP